ncbi:MAG: ferritin [Bacteroidota bacterium]
MISKSVEKAINTQIKVEEESSRIYLAMASWLETKGFPGAAAFLYRQTEEERMHLLKFIKYLNDRGGHAQIAELKAPETEFTSLKEVFDKVLKHEEFVTESINTLYGVTIDAKDYTTGTFLQWFITEQIEEESTMRSIIDKMALLGTETSGYFLIDKELATLALAPITAI